MNKWTITKYVGLTTLAIFVLSLITSALGIIEYSIVAPWREDVKREVWEETNSRVKGANQEIAKR